MQAVDAPCRLLSSLRRTSSDHDRIVRVDDGFRLVRDFAQHVKWRSNVNMYSPSSQRRDAKPLSSSEYLSSGGMFHKSEDVCLCICKFLSAVVRLVYAQIQNTYQSSLHMWPYNAFGFLSCRIPRWMTPNNGFSLRLRGLSSSASKKWDSLRTGFRTARNIDLIGWHDASCKRVSARVNLRREFTKTLPEQIS